MHGIKDYCLPPLTHHKAWHQLSKIFQLKHASTFRNGANRWKPQIPDWPCSCSAVLGVMPGGTKWQCSGDTDGTSEAQDRWQARPLQTEPCCSLLAWTGLGTRRRLSPAAPALTQHSSADHSSPVSALTVGPCQEINTQMLLMDILVMQH